MYVCIYKCLIPSVANQLNEFDAVHGHPILQNHMVSYFLFWWFCLFRGFYRTWVLLVVFSFALVGLMFLGWCERLRAAQVARARQTAAEYEKATKWLGFGLTYGKHTHQFFKRPHVVSRCDLLGGKRACIWPFLHYIFCAWVLGSKLRDVQSPGPHFLMSLYAHCCLPHMELSPTQTLNQTGIETDHLGWLTWHGMVGCVWYWMSRQNPSLSSRWGNWKFWQFLSPQSVAWFDLKKPFPSPNTKTEGI